MAGLANKYGLRPAGEKLSKLQIEKEIKDAQDKVTSDFEHERWRELTEIAVCHVYKDAYDNLALHQQAGFILVL